MKVVIVRDRPLSGGGISSFFENIEGYLSIEYKYVDTGRPFDFYGKTGRLMKIGSIRLMYDYAKLFITIIFFNPKVVHINSSVDRKKRSLRRDSVNILIAKLFGKKVILFWHGFYCKGAKCFPIGGIPGKLLKWVYNLSDIFIVLSDGIKKDVENWSFASPVILGRTSYDTKLLSLEGEGRGVLPIKILFMASILRNKGIFELIEAYRMMREKGAEVELLIAGDGPELAHVEEKVSQEEIHGVFFAGFVSGEKKTKLYEEASVFCLPSYDEAMPVAVLEAMAAELPVVATLVGALKGILVDGKTGYSIALKKGPDEKFFPDPQEIYEKLLKLTEDRIAMKKMGKYNRELARRDFHPSVAASEIEAAYRFVSGGCLR